MHCVEGVLKEMQTPSSYIPTPWYIYIYTHPEKFSDLRWNTFIYKCIIKTKLLDYTGNSSHNVMLH